MHTTRIRGVDYNGPMIDELKIGPIRLPSAVLLAPMCGITDAPFRKLCVDWGAGLAATEMTPSDHRVRHSADTNRRLDFRGVSGIRVAQIAGSEPDQMAAAARAAVARGAQIVDINLGCPAKKVCRRLAGSALMKDEDLVRRILGDVVDAVQVPVTVKMRTGWSPEIRNGIKVAQIAESEGVAALAVHGRTRACGYKGEVEYKTIRAIKSAIKIPVFANGDITTPEKAAEVLRLTNADGVMIGRGAQGQPWLFERMSRFLAEKINISDPSIQTRRDIILAHLDSLYCFYGEHIGVRVARKHLTWYCKNLGEAEEFRIQAVRCTSSAEQMRLTKAFFDRRLGERDETAPDYSSFGEAARWQNQEKLNRRLQNRPANQSVRARKHSRTPETAR